MRSIWNGSYKKLPPDLLASLLIGSVGVLHLGTMAETILNSLNGSSEKQLYLSLGSDMLLAAFEHDCLNASFASQVEVLEKAFPFINPNLKPVLQWLGNNYKRPSDLRYFMRILEKRESDKTMYFLGEQVKKEPGNAFWLHHTYVTGIVENNPQWLKKQLGKAVNVPEPIMNFLTANIAFMENDLELASAEYQKAIKLLPLAVWQDQLAETLYRIGETQAAQDTLTQVVKDHPWQVNSLLRLYDISTGLAQKTAPPEGKGVILFYTWNKDTLLDEALKAVCENERYGAKLLVLDNGSTDNTAAVIAAWKEKLGADLITVQLPVNVGAPAARNWLAAMDEAKNADWLAYMDDDAIVPSDWLGKLGAAMQAYPEAGVYGCKVVDMQNNMTIQSADFHLTPSEGSVDEDGTVDRKFQTSAIQLQCFDFGHFNYIRPCSSVTGCCHLFRRTFFDKVGGFDLRYSPSQYDDLEHDLRHAMQGQLPVYQGHLTIRHAKRTGKEAIMNASQMSNSLGNLMKLHMRYSQEEFNSIMQHDKEQSLADILNKWDSLEFNRGKSQ